MKKLVMKKLLIITTHVIALAIGFALGIYALPILTAPEAPADHAIAALGDSPLYQGQFIRELEGSDFLHWGEGTLYVYADTIALRGELAPGPDYKLYLSPEFVETEDAFNRLKVDMRQLGDVKTFNNFMVAVPTDVDLNNYNTAIVWCESFGEFISAAQYK